MSRSAKEMEPIERKMDEVIAVMRPGQRFTCKQIEELTGLSRAAAHAIEKRALKKLRKSKLKLWLDNPDPYYSESKITTAP